MVIFPACDSKESHETKTDVYTAEYINGISIEEPERALALIDTAEQRKLLDEYDVDRLRCVVYHNGLSDNINALKYALKAYDAPSARDNIKSFLTLLEICDRQADMEWPLYFMPLMEIRKKGTSNI